ncbi:branched-chain amino acid aminotransferase [Catalinimonas alkaloidigena]|uniref:aminotransferase class IV n=1 Tax=Catalinimonas alkaloidigena TaxID=1075417 RepID=UPI0024076E6D|nr:aminotransferase class IV [Catalinimonas alkaloidigena]MDF9798245.1 branched-chain amino acid aminotransferase [Catalinimonas alkaloidigena]
MLQKFNPKNADIQVYVKDGLYPRSAAKVSVFDSSVQGGDAVWEGLRVYKNKIFCLDRHLNRLQDSAKALLFDNVPSNESIKQAIFQTLEANGMKDDTHIRLTLTRGEKVTSGMDPRVNQDGCCLIVLAEWKPPVYDNEKGIRVITSGIARNSPKHLDSKIHHNNLLNNILAKIQANVAGADAAIMLDAYGFVSELNDTNLFMVKGGKLYTPHADACLHGITRGLTIEIGRSLGIEVIEKNLSLTEFYTADEVFATGTMGEMTPVSEMDGRKIENKTGEKLLPKLRGKFVQMIDELSESLPF